MINTTITTGVTAPNDTFELPEAEAERLLAGKLLLNGGGTYDARRPRNFNTYRKPRSSLNQTFEEVPHVDPDTTVVLPAAGQTFVAPKPVLDKHAVMNSTFGIVGDEQIGGAANGHGTFVRMEECIKGLYYLPTYYSQLQYFKKGYKLQPVPTFQDNNPF